MKKRKLTSWQKRRIRRIKIGLYTTLFCVILFCMISVILSLRPYESVDLTEYCTYEYGGYNHKGSVTVDLELDKISELMRSLKETYDKKFIHMYSVSAEDYNAFFNSLSVETNVPDNLSNGSVYTYQVNYDKELAKKIRLRVYEDRTSVTVTGLVTATVLKVDDLFKDLKISFEGVSPKITITLENKSESPFIKGIVFSIVDPKEYYSLNDIFYVRAYFSEAECLDKHFAVEKPSEDCIMNYEVLDVAHYVQSADDLPQEIVDEAVRAASKAFTKESAMEFGLRVFSEANIMYVTDSNKKYTFDWKSYGVLSGYFKVPNTEIAGNAGNSYNDLDIVFNCMMNQANGTECKAEAVVRFSNIQKLSDGTYDYDFSKPKIISVSHLDSRIKKNVITNYEGRYSIEKLSVR